MFWTDWSNTNPRVMKSAMSGYNISILINGSAHNLVWPNGLYFLAKVDSTNFLMNLFEVKQPLLCSFVVIKSWC